MFEPDQPRLVEGMRPSTDTQKLSLFLLLKYNLGRLPVTTLEQHLLLNLGFPPLLDSLLVRFIISPRPSFTL